jgi:hypothetical protein
MHRCFNSAVTMTTVTFSSRASVEHECNHTSEQQLCWENISSDSDSETLLRLSSRATIQVMIIINEEMKVSMSESCVFLKADSFRYRKTVSESACAYFPAVLITLTRSAYSRKQTHNPTRASTMEAQVMCIVYLYAQITCMRVRCNILVYV